MEHNFCIENICNVKVGSSKEYKTQVDYIVLKNKIEIDLLNFLPEKHVVKVGCGPAYDVLDKIVYVDELPDFKDVSDLPDADEYRYRLGLDWLLGALHEMGHAYNGYQYSHNDIIMSRDRAMTMDRSCSLTDVSDLLNDETGAWDFALDQLKFIGVSGDNLLEVFDEISEKFVHDYFTGSLHKEKVKHVTDVQSNHYINTISGMYQDWLNQRTKYGGTVGSKQ